MAPDPYPVPAGGSRPFVSLAEWAASPNRNRYRDLVSCDRGFHWNQFDRKAYLQKMDTDLAKAPDAKDRVHGEWIGLMKMSAAGLAQLKGLGREISGSEGFRKMRMADLLNQLVARGTKIEVVYVRGHWQ